MVFYERDMQILPSYHTRRLYVTPYVLDAELKHELINLGSSLIIMPLSVLEEVGIT